MCFVFAAVFMQKMQTSHRPVQWLAVMLLVIVTTGQCQQSDRWAHCSHLISEFMNNNYYLFITDFICFWCHFESKTVFTHLKCIHVLRNEWTLFVVLRLRL